MALLRDRVDDVLRRGVLGDGDDVDARNHDVARGGLFQAQHVVDHLAFFGFDDAVVVVIPSDDQQLSSEPAGTVGMLAAEESGERSAAPSERADSGRMSIATKRARVNSAPAVALGGARQRAGQPDRGAGRARWRRGRRSPPILGHPARDHVGHQAGGQGDGDRLHQLQCGDERAAGIEQGLDAALAWGRSRLGGTGGG